MSFPKDDEAKWRAKMKRSKTNNFVALLPTAELKSKGFEKVSTFDSRGFLRWKVMARVKAWCRSSSS